MQIGAPTEFVKVPAEKTFTQLTRTVQTSQELWNKHGFN